MEALGYEFKDEALLAEALTTPACKIDDPAVRDNQRLEFLGDAVLGMICARFVYGAFPGSEEGVLAVNHHRMVSAAALCEAAGRLGFAGMLRVNRGASAPPEGSKTVADAVEAVIGAAYLDGGLAAAEKIVAALGLSANASGGEWAGNPKGELQVLSQAMDPPRLPEYSLISTSGPAHEPVFTMKVRVEGMGEATASARSHKEAEALAAARLLLWYNKQKIQPNPSKEA